MDDSGNDSTCYCYYILTSTFTVSIGIYEHARYTPKGHAKQIVSVKLSPLYESHVLYRMRLSARQASLVWRDRQAKPLDTAVYWVERVARWGHASILHGASRDIPFYQLALLDIIGAGVLGLLLLLLLLRQSLKLLMNSVTSIFESRKKVETH